MADYRERYTEAQLRAFSDRIEEVYKQAAREIRDKLGEYTKRHRAEEARMRAKLAAGEITQAEYQDWMRRTMFQGQRWERQLRETTDAYVNADKKAREILSGTRQNVFVESANYAAYEIEQDTGAAVTFDLYDADTVRRLMRDDPQMLPAYRINEPKDYIWNQRRVQNAVTQAIIQGESIPQLTQRLTSELAASNAGKMETFARTAMTGAQNAGRIERMRETEEMGVRVKKRWLATLDDRTRDAHQELDGQEAEVDEPFDSPLGPIMCPGDPSADPGNTYNCRCRMQYVYPDLHLSPGMRRDQMTGELVRGDITYKEWKAGKIAKEAPQDPPQAKTTPRHVEFTPAGTIQEAEEFARQFLGYNGTVSYRGIALDYANTCNRVLADVQATYDVPGLGNISAMNMRSNTFRNTTADAAYRWGANQLFINPTYYKGTKAYDQHRREIDGLMETVLGSGQKLIDAGKVSGVKRDYIQALIDTRRQCVSQSHDFVEGTFVHECGHRLDDAIFRKALREAYGADSVKHPVHEFLSESRHKYGGHISGYAITDNNEYVAESFTAWWFGEGDKCDPVLVGVFERTMKK